MMILAVGDKCSPCTCCWFCELRISSNLPIFCMKNVHLVSFLSETEVLINLDQVLWMTQDPRTYQDTTNTKYTDSWIRLQLFMCFNVAWNSRKKFKSTSSCRQEFSLSKSYFLIFITEWHYCSNWIICQLCLTVTLKLCLHRHQRQEQYLKN
jgi:hypothetical protein